MNFGWRGMSADEARIYFEEARDQAIAAGDVRANALIHGAYGRIFAAGGSADEYEAAAIAAEVNDPSLQVTLKAVLCHALRLSGRMSKALVVYYRSHGPRARNRQVRPTDAWF
jgi:hypothetical protein